MTMSTDIDKIKVQHTDTIDNLIRVLQKSGSFACALVYDKDYFLNIITDGDIRRTLSAGFGLHDGVEAVLKTKQSGTRPNAIVAAADASSEEIDFLFRKHALRQLVLVDERRIPVAIIDHLSIDRALPHVNQPFVAVVMAGGFGTRLMPLTLDTPKPMLPIRGKPLLEILLQQLVMCGAEKVYITTYYLAEKISSYFGSGEKLGIQIEYIHEHQPLGTGGGLGLIPQIQQNTLVVNGDVLTDLDFSLFHSEHIRSGADMTIASTQYSIQVPYGVLTERNGEILEIEEKPKFAFNVNSGIYFVSPEVFEYLPKCCDTFSMVDLANNLLKNSRSIRCFPIFERWIDIGRPDDYYAANQDCSTY